MEAAIARAFGRPAAAVARAVMLTGDLGEAALLALDDRLADARLRLFHPLRFMLASPAEDAAEIITRLGPEVWTEDKYDGIRAQLHRASDEVRLFSRDLHDVTGQFPEVAAAARGLPWDGILDGELLAFRDGGVLPFLALQKRLGRKAAAAGARSRRCPSPSSPSTSSRPVPAAARWRPCWTCRCGSDGLGWRPRSRWGRPGGTAAGPTRRPLRAQPPGDGRDPPTTWSASSPRPARAGTRG